MTYLSRFECDVKIRIIHEHCRWLTYRVRHHGGAPVADPARGKDEMAYTAKFSGQWQLSTYTTESVHDNI